MYRNLPSSANGSVSTTTAYGVEILLDQPIYNPGDILTGLIKLDLKKKLCCELVTVQLYGSARVLFTEKIVRLVLSSFLRLFQTKPGALGQTKAYEQENVLVNLKTDVWKCPENEKPKREVTVGLYQD